MAAAIEEAKEVLEGAGDESAIIEIMLKLDEEVSPIITKDLLSSTKIGHLVTKLKTHDNPDISARAKMLVEKWKILIKGAAGGGGGGDDGGGSGGGGGTTTGGGGTTTSGGDTITGGGGTTTDDPNSTTSLSGRKRGCSEMLPSSRNPLTSQDLLEPVLYGVTEDSVFGGKYTKNEKRNRCRDILFKSFIEGFAPDQLNMVDKNQLENLIADMEQHLWDFHVTKNNKQADYTAQLRSIKSNLGDKKNPEFNCAIYLGGISLEQLPTMSSVEMASDAKKQERRKAQKDALEACQSDWDLRNVKRAKGQFPCGKCRSDNTTYFQMQTRSSDEPMTTYVNCLNCGNRWKF